MNPRRPVADAGRKRMVHGLAVFGGLVALVIAMVALLVHAASNGTAVL